ncbi:MAG TPA: serine hydrolase domain-containing protein, partial [Acidimicrobiales bacterium]
MTLRLFSTELADPEEVGIDPRKLDVFLARAKVEVESGLLPSVQVAVAARGKLVAFSTFGDASNDSRYILQSVGRNVVAAAVWKAFDDGVLTADQRIAELVPEFGTNGKEVVTLEQVLTHSAGFPFAPLGYPKMLSRDARLEAFAKWRLDWEPGSRLQFHLTSQAWVVVELIERLYEVTFAE